ncbi:MAG TPA: hypothetical protein VF060_08295 [Trebonia sp.]
MSSVPVLLAVMDNGGRWEDPSEDLLYILLEDLEERRAKRMRVERLDEAGHALEIARQRKVFRVRRYEAGQVSLAESANRREVHAACTRWAFRMDRGMALWARAQWGGFDGTLDWQIVPSGRGGM